MSVYEVNLAGRLALHDPEFRERLHTDPESALGELDLTGDEHEALLAGDIGRLYQRGAHEYLLWNLARFGLLGLDVPTFSDRIRAAGRRSGDDD